MWDLDDVINNDALLMMHFTSNFTLDTEKTGVGSAEGAGWT